MPNTQLAVQVIEKAFQDFVDDGRARPLFSKMVSDSAIRLLEELSLRPTQKHTISSAQELYSALVQMQDRFVSFGNLYLLATLKSNYDHLYAELQDISEQELTLEDSQ